MNKETQNVGVATETIPDITLETTIIDVISRHRQTEAIFKRLEEETGVCICCQALFLPLGEAAQRYGFDLKRALADIQNVINK